MSSSAAAAAAAATAFSSTSTTSSSETAISSSSSLPHQLRDCFLEQLEASKEHAKSILKQQVDAILEDFFSQLAAKVWEMLKVAGAAGECLKIPPSCTSAAADKSTSAEELLLSKVESVVCEPIIEMCLMGEEEEASQQEKEQKQVQQTVSPSSSIQNDQAKTAKSSPKRSSKLVQSKSCRKAAPPEVMTIKVEEEEEEVKIEEMGSDDQNEVEEEGEDMMMSRHSILGSSLMKCSSSTTSKVNHYHHHHHQRQTFQRAAAGGQLTTSSSSSSHVFEVHQVSSAAHVSELQLGDSPPPPLQPPPLAATAAAALPKLPSLPAAAANDNNLWICHTCDKKMKNERTLYMHQWRYHKEGKFCCESCPFIASYRIQLRTHQIRFHDLGKFSCPFPGCGRSFNRRNSLKRHERIHLRLKPYRCRVCDYASELRSSMIDHVRVTHFRLPRSRKEQLEMSIGDDRDPADYFEVIQEGLDLLEPVLEHVHSVLEAQQQQQAAAAAAVVLTREDAGGGERGGGGSNGLKAKAMTAVIPEKEEKPSTNNT